MKIKHGINGSICLEVQCSKCLKFVGANDKYCRTCGARLIKPLAGNANSVELVVYPADVIALVDEVTRLRALLAQQQPDVGAIDLNFQGES